MRLFLLLAVVVGILATIGIHAEWSETHVMAGEPYPWTWFFWVGFKESIPGPRMLGGAVAIALMFSGAVAVMTKIFKRGGQ